MNVLHSPSRTGGAVSPDLQSDIVMDDLCEALVQVEFEEAAGSVNGVARRCAKCLVCFDHFKGVPESDLARLNNEVREPVERVLHQDASLVH